MHGESKPPPTLTFVCLFVCFYLFIYYFIFFLMMERMLVIDEGQEPYQVSLSHTMRSTITNVGIRARLAKAWEMTL